MGNESSKVQNNFFAQFFLIIWDPLDSELRRAVIWPILGINIPFGGKKRVNLCQFGKCSPPPLSDGINRRIRAQRGRKTRKLATFFEKFFFQNFPKNLYSKCLRIFSNILIEKYFYQMNWILCPNRTQGPPPISNPPPNRITSLRWRGRGHHHRP